MKKEALRYLENAKEILNKSPIEDNTYMDVKDSLKNSLISSWSSHRN